MQTATKPVQSIRIGAVTAALWQNEISINGRPVRILKATLERRYRDAGGVWKSSGSFSRSEVPSAIMALFKAFDAMTAANNAEGNEVFAEDKAMH